jgi:hypothetical protein
LAHDERLAPDVDERAVEAALLVLEDTKSRDLAREPLRDGRVVVGRDPQQNRQA